jgi:PAS domain S-box-containing protein
MGLFGGKKKNHANALASSLQSEKVKSEIVISTIEDGVVFIDAARMIQLYNPAAAKISGWLAGEAVGLDYKLVVKLTDLKGNAYAPDQHPFERVFVAKTTIHDNAASLSTRNSKSVEIDISVSPLLSDTGEVLGAVGIFRDVSNRRREEKQRADFISTASHEMRTPVAAIEGYLALALNDRVSKVDMKARGFLEKAHESTQHLGQLFQDLLTSAKAEDGRLTSHPVAVEMGDFVEKLTDSLHFVAEKKGLGIEFMFGSGGNSFKDASKVVKPLYYVYADPDRVREVITNLFDNAVKYTETGKITLSLTGDDKVVQFRIHDTGPGIPTEDQPHLFQKFYRVDNSATRTIGGTGLGLFICKKIIELYDGRIWVESTLGQGSTFFINLPRLSTDKVAVLQAQEANNSVMGTVLPQS